MRRCQIWVQLPARAIVVRREEKAWWAGKEAMERSALATNVGVKVPCLRQLAHVLSWRCSWAPEKMWKHTSREQGDACDRVSTRVVRSEHSPIVVVGIGAASEGQDVDCVRVRWDDFGARHRIFGRSTWLWLGAVHQGEALVLARRFSVGGFVCYCLQVPRPEGKLRGTGRAQERDGRVREIGGSILVIFKLEWSHSIVHGIERRYSRRSGWTVDEHLCGKVPRSKRGWSDTVLRLQCVESELYDLRST